MEFIIYDGDGATLRDFPPESLAPPVDILGASAAARKGERPIDPLAALVRNVLAVDRPRSNVRRLWLSRGLKLPVIPPEIHAAYQTAFAARINHYTQAGKTEAEARALALDDLGCEQFFAHLKEQPAPSVSATSALPQPDRRSQVERARIRAANGAKVKRMRAQWATDKIRAGKGEAA
jgi:hypothetical protein